MLKSNNLKKIAFIFLAFSQCHNAFGGFFYDLLVGGIPVWEQRIKVPITLTDKQRKSWSQISGKDSTTSTIRPSDVIDLEILTRRFPFIAQYPIDGVKLNQKNVNLDQNLITVPIVYCIMPLDLVLVTAAIIAANFGYKFIK